MPFIYERDWDGVESDFRYGMCPQQVEGTSNMGPFYFRERHERWHLWVGPKDAPPDYVKWADRERLLTNGYGPITPDEIDRVLTQYLGEWRRNA